MEYFGKIKHINQEKGYGFIVCQDNKQSYYFKLKWCKTKIVSGNHVFSTPRKKGNNLL